MFRDETKSLEKADDGKIFFYIPLYISPELFSRYHLFKVAPESQREYIYQQLRLYKDMAEITGATELVFEKHFKYQSVRGIEDRINVVVALEISKEDIKSCNSFIGWENAYSIQLDKVSIDKIKALYVYHKVGAINSSKFNYIVEFDKFYDNSISNRPLACVIL